MMVEENYAELVVIVDKCVVVNHKKAIVPVKVVSLEEGTLPTNIERNVLGKVLHSKDVEVSIKNVKSKYVNTINVDTLTTEDGLSNVYYSMESNNGKASLNEYEELVSFDLEYTFTKIPSSINVLGNNVYLNDAETCEVINGYKTDVVVDSNTNVVENNLNYIPIVVCIILVIIAASEFIVIKRKK